GICGRYSLAFRSVTARALRLEDRASRLDGSAARGKLGAVGTDIGMPLLDLTGRSCATERVAALRLRVGGRVAAARREQRDRDQQRGEQRGASSSFRLPASGLFHVSPWKNRWPSAFTVHP